MLSDKIKSKSALKARTFLHVVRDKVHACYWYRLSIKTVQATCSVFKYFSNPSLAKCLPIRSIRSIGILQQWSAMVINMDFLCQYIVTDIKQTCLGQGLGVTITVRKRTSKLMFTMKDFGHSSDLYIYRSLVIPCLVVKIEHLQVTVDDTMQTTALNN